MDNNFENLKDFNYTSNKIGIDKKINIMKRKISYFNPVRIRRAKTKRFSKEATCENFSKEIFYIYLIKRPLFKTNSLQLKLIDKHSNIVIGAFALSDLKILPFNNLPFTIDEIVKRYSLYGHHVVDIKVQDLTRTFTIPEKLLRFFAIKQ